VMRKYLDWLTQVGPSFSSRFFRYLIEWTWQVPLGGFTPGHVSGNARGQAHSSPLSAHLLSLRRVSVKGRLRDVAEIMDHRWDVCWVCTFSILAFHHDHWNKFVHILVRWRVRSSGRRWSPLVLMY